MPSVGGLRHGWLAWRGDAGRGEAPAGDDEVPRGEAVVPVQAVTFRLSGLGRRAVSLRPLLRTKAKQRADLWRRWKARRERAEPSVPQFNRPGELFNEKQRDG